MISLGCELALDVEVNAETNNNHNHDEHYVLPFYVSWIRFEPLVGSIAKNDK